MKTTRIFPVLLALALGAFVDARPLQAQEAVPAIDPVGMYDFQASMGIEVRTGTIELERNAEGHLVGEAWLEGESDPAMIESGVVTGSHVDLYAFVNGSTQVTFALDFTGSEFSGTIDAGGQTIAVDGTRRAP